MLLQRLHAVVGWLDSRRTGQQRSRSARQGNGNGNADCRESEANEAGPCPVCASTNNPTTIYGKIRQRRLHVRIVR